MIDFLKRLYAGEFPVPHVLAALVAVILLAVGIVLP